MLKTVCSRLHFCPLNSRHVVKVARNFSALQTEHNKKYDRSNNSSDHRPHLLVDAALPSFLAFFNKEPEEGEEKESKESFLDRILPEEVALLLKKLPEEDETTPEGKLKTTLKRTILCIRKGEFDKAEQMAHLALRMAQDMQHYDAITLCFDIMANLAFDREQYKKAEALFVDVLQRLLTKGVPQDDIQVLHISLKVAQLVELQGKKDEAKTNYIWTVTKLDEKVKKEPENKDLFELWGLANYYYGKFLLRQGKYKDALPKLKSANEGFVQTRGKFDPDYVNILNDLAVASLHVDDVNAAEQYIEEAIILASPYTELIGSGIYHANKGLILLKKGLLREVQQACKHADRISKSTSNSDGQEQSKYCLEQIQKAMKK